MVNDGTLKNRADFASALNNVNNVKISDLLKLLFSSLCSQSANAESFDEAYIFF